MGLSRADIIADVCIIAGTLALTAGALVRERRRIYPEQIARSLRLSMVWGVLVVASMSDGVQVLLDRLTGIPNLGMLVRLTLLPIGLDRNLALLDDLVGAGWRQRLWHRGGALAAVAITVFCWQNGVSHRQSLPTIPVAVPLDGANARLYALAWLYPIEVIVQAGEGARLNARVLLHLYVTGYGPVPCATTLMFTGAQLCLCALGAGLVLYPPGQLTGHAEWIDLSTSLTEGFGLAAILLAVGAATLTLWAPRAEVPRAEALERPLRALLLFALYSSVRGLALELDRVVDKPQMPVRPDQTSLWRVRRLDDLDLLLQLHKTAINDARLILAPYVGEVAFGPNESAQERAAAALRAALRNYHTQHQPGREPPDNPLRDAPLWDDERFLAAVWRSLRQGEPPMAESSERQDTRSRVPVGPSRPS